MIIVVVVAWGKFGVICEAAFPVIKRKLILKIQYTQLRQY